jgi:hypothetical protein
MQHLSFLSTMIVVAAFATIGAFTSALAQAPTPPQAPAQPPAAVKPGPYKTVAIKLPTPMNDASLDAFRKQLAGIAQKKDQAALARLVAANFFWIPEDADKAEKGKPAIDNLAKAIGLGGTDAVGWEVIADHAVEPSVMPDPQRPGVICAPALPVYDEKAAKELTDTTQTDLTEWVYPVRDGLEVRSGPQQEAAVVEKLGLHLVRLLDEESASGSFLKMITPSGKTGYVLAEAIRDIVESQMCFAKVAGGWKIAGYLGGDPGN